MTPRNEPSGTWPRSAAANSSTSPEALSPAAFFMWLAVAAGTVGLVLSVSPDLGWQAQLVLFALFSVLSLILGRRYLRRHPIATDEPTLNKRGHQYIGRRFTLDEPITNGQGKIRVDDSTWKVVCSDCDAGATIEIVGVDGVVLEARVAGETG